MMPGVVAGFPRKPAGSTFSLTSGTSGSYNGYSWAGGYGSTVPAFPNVVGATGGTWSTPGAILMLHHSWTSGSNLGLVQMQIRGQYTRESLPFSAVQYGDITWLKSSFETISYSSSSDTTTINVHGQTGLTNMFSGTKTVTLVP